MTVPSVAKDYTFYLEVPCPPRDLTTSFCLNEFVLGNPASGPKRSRLPLLFLLTRVVQGYLAHKKLWSQLAEEVSVVVFTLEYLLRLCSAHHHRDYKGPPPSLSGDTTPCKVTPAILHGVVSPDYKGKTLPCSASEEGTCQNAEGTLT